MDWLTEHKIPVGAWAADLFDWLQRNGAAFFDALSDALDWLIEAILWVLQTPHPLIVVAVFRRADLCLAAQLEDRAADRPGVPVHHQSGLLGGNHRKPDAGAVGLRGLHGHRRADRNRRRPPAAALCRAPACAGPHADAADLRLSDPGDRVLRHRHGARTDRHGDLCRARTDPADLSGRGQHPPPR